MTYTEEIIVDDFNFKKNYIEEVLFRVDFISIPELTKISVVPDKFIEIIKDDFKILDETMEPNLWAYYSENYSKRIELTPSSIVLSYDGDFYETHKIILEDIEILLKILNEYNVLTVNRVGLRYVNEIKPTKKILNWNDWVNQKLHNFYSVDDKLKLMRSLTQSEFKIDEYILNFTYGQFNSNYPNTKIVNNFVMDYDCYTSSLTDTLSIKSTFKEIHNIIKSTFSKSIEKSLIKDMEEG